MDTYGLDDIDPALKEPENINASDYRHKRKAVCNSLESTLVLRHNVLYIYDYEYGNVPILSSIPTFTGRDGYDIDGVPDTSWWEREPTWKDIQKSVEEYYNYHNRTVQKSDIIDISVLRRDVIEVGIELIELNMHIQRLKTKNELRKLKYKKMRPRLEKVAKKKGKRKVVNKYVDPKEKAFREIMREIYKDKLRRK